MFTITDEYNCGRSLQWERLAFEIAQKKNEACEHLNPYNIFIKTLPPDKINATQIKFEIHCKICNKKLEKTSEKITKKINKLSFSAR